MSSFVIGIMHREMRIKIYSNGDIYFYKGNELHNENGPAIIGKDGYISWYLDGWRYEKSGWRKEIEERKNIDNTQ